MKRAAAHSTPMSSPSKRLKRTTTAKMEPTNDIKETRVEDLPKELQTEIFARIAKHSIIDLLNAKLSYKLFYEIGEDTYVYRNVNLLEKTKMVPGWYYVSTWTPTELEDYPCLKQTIEDTQKQLQQLEELQQQEEAFMKKCNGNPEIFIRKAIWNFFGDNRDFESAIDSLVKEANNLEAIYVKCIIQIFSNCEEERRNGTRLLCELKKSDVAWKRIREYRARILPYIKSVYSNQWIPLRQNPYCSKQHPRVNPWVKFEEADEFVGCEECSRVDIDIYMVNEAISRDYS